MESVFTSNIQFDNTTDINSVEMPRYSLADLNNFWGEYSSQEESTYGTVSKRKDYSFTYINDMFPIQILRHNKNNYYIVYKVKEGGLYYVFLLMNDNNISIADTFYINKLKQKADFSSLIIGKSSYKDVYEIDPASELMLILSNGVYSYSILDDKNLLEIEYSFTNIRGRSDLIISAINIVSVDQQHGSKLEAILSKDLPAQ